MSEEGKFPFEGTPKVGDEFQEKHNKTQDMIDAEKERVERTEEAQEEKVYDEPYPRLIPPGMDSSDVVLSTYGRVEEPKSAYVTNMEAEKTVESKKESENEIRDSGIKTDVGLKSDFDHAQEGEIE